MQCLCDQLNDTTSLGDLSLRLLGEPPSANDERNLGESALAENLAVAEGEEVEDGDGIALLGDEVLVALLGGDQRPELENC